MKELVPVIKHTWAKLSEIRGQDGENMKIQNINRNQQNIYMKIQSINLHGTFSLNIIIIRCTSRLFQYSTILTSKSTSEPYILFTRKNLEKTPIVKI